MGVIYTDYSKLFGRIVHKLFGHMLSTSGFGKPLISCLIYYLTDRKQYVNLNGITSDVITPSSGIPQEANPFPL